MTSTGVNCDHKLRPLEYSDGFIQNYKHFKDGRICEKCGGLRVSKKVRDRGQITKMPEHGYGMCCEKHGWLINPPWQHDGPQCKPRTYCPECEE